MSRKDVIEWYRSGLEVELCLRDGKEYGGVKEWE